MFDIDLLGYSASIAMLETGDIVQAHKIVYAAPLTPTYVERIVTPSRRKTCAAEPKTLTMPGFFFLTSP